MKEILAIRNGYQAHQLWQTDGICPCLTAAMGCGGYSRDSLCVAMRGRNPTGKYKQQLEPRFDGYCNTLTSVSKDNLILEVK